jgi:hypothetical protein
MEMLRNTDWLKLLKKWWVTLFLIPFIIYHLHQAYWALRFNIFFTISYDFPFPINLENFLVTNFLLIIHEAGHTFFSFFGNRTITILGGSLYEILLPLIIVGYFYYNRFEKGLQLALYLLGSAWLSVAFYAADGGQQQLPLIANLGRESHDWLNLLSRWDLLEHDHTIGIIFASIGAICYLLSLVTPVLFNQYSSFSESGLLNDIL